MRFSDYYTAQARKPSGLFGRLVMPLVFNRGNAFLNRFVAAQVAVAPDDRILEIGCGPGKLIAAMAEKIETGRIDGIDFSPEMVAAAEKRNAKRILQGVVAIQKADFGASTDMGSRYTKACSVNTLYFWKDPRQVLEKAIRLLEPGGRFVLGLEDAEQLKGRRLSKDIFRIYSKDEVLQMFAECDALEAVKIKTRRKGRQLFHCAVATKQAPDNLSRRGEKR